MKPPLLVFLRPANLAGHISGVDCLIAALEVNLVTVAHTANIAAAGIVELITVAVAYVVGPKSYGADHHANQHKD